MKIENDELWNKIKEGELKGLSIEGYFTNKFEQMNKKQPTTEQILSALNELIRENKTELKTEKVELGLTDDIETQSKQFKSIEQEAKGLTKKLANDMAAVKQADKNVKQYLSVQQDFHSLYKKVDKMIMNLRKAAKELNVKVETLPAYKGFYDMSNNAFVALEKMTAAGADVKKMLK
jgi:DNA repair ATPase RecN